MVKNAKNLTESQIASMMDKPLYALTLGEFLAITQQTTPANPLEGQSTGNARTAYGLAGLASLLGCSVPTASRLKKSGIFDPAISQVNRKIVIDVEKALAIISKQK